MRRTAAILFLLSILCTHVRAADITVAQDGSGDFRTVQEAINACPDYEHSRITTILIKRFESMAS